MQNSPVSRGEFPETMGNLVEKGRPDTGEKIKRMLDSWGSKIRTQAKEKTSRKIELLYFKVCEEMLA